MELIQTQNRMADVGKSVANTEFGTNTLLPLVVDLDGTLIRSDMLYESFWHQLSKSLVDSALSVCSLKNGRAALKRRLSEDVNLNVVGLPYNRQVIDLIIAHRDAGGKTAMVTATDQRLAQQVADHLGLFDEVHGSDGQRNLKNSEKARFLIKMFGQGGFDYVGDSSADLPVWSAARNAVAVNAPNSVRDSLKTSGQDVQFIDDAPGLYHPMVIAMRPHQWAKNLLIFVPAFVAHITDPGAWIAALVTFAAFCLVASGVYVLNDLCDLDADRAHPRKRFRPLASGSLHIVKGTLLAPILMLTGFAIAALAGDALLVGVFLAYFLMTTAYSFYLKRKIVIDICMLASLYTIRIIAGIVATGAAASMWLLAFSMFIFLALAAVKRQTELVDGEKAQRSEISGRAYLVGDIEIVSMMALSASYVAVMVFALYLDSATVRNLYAAPELLWLVCPVLLYWTSRLVVLAHRGIMDDDPIVFAMRDRVSRVCAALIVGVFVAATFVSL